MKTAHLQLLAQKCLTHNMKKPILLFFLTACIRTEVINAPIESIDTMVVTRVDTTEVVEEDTTRVEIGFNPSVEDWEDTEIDY